MATARAAIVEWTGDGAATQIVACLFVPAVVIHCTPGMSGGVWRSTAMDEDGQTDAVRLDTGAVLSDSLLALGPGSAFTVGTALNNDGTAYMAMVFSEGDGFAQGGYAGAGGTRQVSVPFIPQFEYVAHYGEDTSPVTQVWTATDGIAPTPFPVARPSAVVKSTSGAVTYSALPASDSIFAAARNYGDFRAEVSLDGATMILRRGVEWPEDPPFIEWDTRADPVGLAIGPGLTAVTETDGVTAIAASAYTYHFVAGVGGLGLGWGITRNKSRPLPPIVRLYFARVASSFRTTVPPRIIRKEHRGQPTATDEITGLFTLTDGALDGYGNIITATGYTRIQYIGPGDRPASMVYGALAASVNVITQAVLPVYRTRSLTAPVNASRWLHAASLDFPTGLALHANGLGIDRVSVRAFTVSAEQNIPGASYYWFAMRPRPGFLSLIPYTGRNGAIVWGTDASLVLTQQTVSLYTRNASGESLSLLTEDQHYQRVLATPAVGQMTLFNRGLWSAQNGGTTATPAVMTRAAVTRVTSTDGLTVYTLGVHYSSSVVAGVTTLTQIAGLPADVRIEGVIGSGTMVAVPTNDTQEIRSVVTVNLDSAVRAITGAGDGPLFAWTVPAPRPKSDLDLSPLEAGPKSEGTEIYWRSVESAQCRGLADGTQDSAGITSIDDDGITLGNSRNVNAVGGVYDALFFLPPVDAGVVCGHPTATDPCVEVEDP